MCLLFTEVDLPLSGSVVEWNGSWWSHRSSCEVFNWRHSSVVI